jgi:hypothetical protein
MRSGGKRLERRERVRIVGFEVRGEWYGAEEPIPVERRRVGERRSGVERRRGERRRITKRRKS